MALLYDFGSNGRFQVDPQSGSVKQWDPKAGAWSALPGVTYRNGQIRAGNQVLGTVSNQDGRATYSAGGRTATGRVVQNYTPAPPPTLDPGVQRGYTGPYTNVGGVNMASYRLNSRNPTGLNPLKTSEAMQLLNRTITDARGNVFRISATRPLGGDIYDASGNQIGTMGIGPGGFTIIRDNGGKVIGSIAFGNDGGLYFHSADNGQRMRITASGGNAAATQQPTPGGAQGGGAQGGGSSALPSAPATGSSAVTGSANLPSANMQVRSGLLDYATRIAHSGVPSVTPLFGAQAHPAAGVYDFGGKGVYEVDAGGNVWKINPQDNTRERAGFYADNGNIVDNNGNVIGQLTRDGNKATYRIGDDQAVGGFRSTTLPGMTPIPRFGRLFGQDEIGRFVPQVDTTSPTNIGALQQRLQSLPDAPQLGGVPQADFTTAPAPRIASPEAITPAQAQLAPDEMVAGRVAQLTSENSPLMQLARTRALQQANARGLLNSSMAVGAAENAVIAAALPIAQADAQLTQNIRLANQQAINEIAKFNAQLAAQVDTANAQIAAQIGQFNAEQANRLSQFNTQVALDAAKTNLAMRAERWNKIASVMGQVILNEQQYAQQLKALQEQAKIQMGQAAFNAEAQARLAARQAEIQQRLNYDKFLQQWDLMRGDAVLRDALVKSEYGMRMIQDSLNAENQRYIQQLESQYKMLIQNSASASQIWSNGMNALGQILSNKELTGTERSIRAQQTIDMMNAGLTWIRRMTGMEADGVIGFQPGETLFDQTRPDPNLTDETRNRLGMTYSSPEQVVVRRPNNHEVVIGNAQINIPFRGRADLVRNAADTLARYYDWISTRRTPRGYDAAILSNPAARGLVAKLRAAMGANARDIVLSLTTGELGALRAFASLPNKNVADRAKEILQRAPT